MGGFGTVYRAEGTSDHKVASQRSRSDDLLRRQVCAMKVQSQVTTPLGITLFHNEIKALKQLNHPNLVSFLDVVECNDMVHLIMEFCDGGDLRTLMEDHVERG